MDLIAYAIPLFLLALVVELLWDRRRGTGFFRFGDAIASLSAGALSTTSGLFTKALEVAVYALLLEHVAPFPLDPALFDISLRGIALFLLVLLAWDFLYYWNHRLGHTVNLLWAAHVVHHQSEDYNLSTALRQTSTGFLLSWIFYVPLLIVGIPAHVVAMAAAIDLIYQFWVHTRHVGSLGWIDRVFVTPSNHRVHHAQNARYLDKNYGGILILWDRLFGTFEPERADEPCVYGVRKPLARWNPIAANLQVYRDAWRLGASSGRWLDRLRVWWQRPNWRPAASGGPLELTDATLADFTRYETAVEPSLRRYVLMQFVVAVLLTAGVSLGAMQTELQHLVAPCLALWALLSSICSLLEDRGGAGMELLRLLLLNPVLAIAIAYAWPEKTLLVATVLVSYTAGSLLWLRRARRTQSTLVAEPVGGRR